MDDAMEELDDINLWDRPLVDVVRFNPVATEHSLSRIPGHVAADLSIRPGFACLFDHDTRRPVDMFFEYLLSQHDGGKYNPNTNRSYAYALKPVAETLKIEGRPSRYLDDEVMTTTITSLLAGRGRLGLPLSGSTIAACVNATARCVEYANGIGLTDISLDVDSHLARGWQVASMFGANGARVDTSTLETARRHMIRPLSRPTIERIKSKLVMDPTKWEPGLPSSRPGLTFSNGRRVGMRLIENLGLTFDGVMRVTVTDPTEEVQFPVLRTKGADYRTIFPLGSDIKRWQAYAVRERKACVAMAREIHGSNWDEPAELFVNGFASGVHVGHATQPSSIQRDFREVLQALGMFTVQGVTMPGGECREVVVYWHCYHDLRHTYAYRMYRAAKERSDHFKDDPLAFVQIRLGHSQPLTTARIYLWPDLRKVSAVGDHAVAGTAAAINA
jgi:hypothetical protein